MTLRLIFVIVAALLFTSCFRHEQKTPGSNGEPGADSLAGLPPPPKMQVRLEPVRILDTVIITDVTGAGTVMTFVTSIDTTKPHPIGARFDRVQAFTFAAQDSSWHEALSDSFTVATSVVMRDVTGDGKPDMIISTTNGHDDSIAAIGCVIYSAHSGAWKEIFTAQTGNPTLQDIDNNGTQDILLHDLYAGVMPPPDAITYISDIYSFDGTTYTASKHKFPAYFQSLVATATEAYTKEKTQLPINIPITDESDFTLYRPCAVVIVSFYATADKIGVKKFWDQEKEYLSRMLTSGQLIDLEAFVKSMATL